MYAIILSYDKQLPFAELLIKFYETLWLDCPLTFRVPFNEAVPMGLKNKKNVELIQTPKAIKDTMAYLLEDIDDETFVFWAIDDRYPINLYFNLLQKTYEFLLTNPPDVDEIKFTSSHKSSVDTSNRIDIANYPFYVQSDGLAGGFYNHHFIKVKILKEYFLSWNLPENYSIYDFHSKLLKHPVEYQVLMPKNQTYIQFAETSHKSQITINAMLDLQHNNLPLPDMKVVERIFLYTDGNKRTSTFNYDLGMIRYLMQQKTSLRAKIASFKNRLRW